MDALNKNFPVAQPDDNDNYEWLEVRAGGGMDSTGTIDIRDGDLDMNGGTIYDWNAFIPDPTGPPGPPAPYWLSQPPCAVGVFNNTTITAVQTNLFTPDILLTTPVRDGGLQPYAEWDFGQHIRVFEPGTYEARISFRCLIVSGNITTIRFILESIDTNQEIVRVCINDRDQLRSSLNPPDVPMRQMVALFPFAPSDFTGVLPQQYLRCRVRWEYVVSGAGVSQLGGGRISCFFSLRKISDNFLGAQAIPP
jgi:hypothetical protein